MTLEQRLWKALRWFDQKVVTPYVPKWIVIIIVAIVFGFLIWLPFSFATVFVMWDWDAWFGLWNRMWLAFWVLIFFFILIKD